MEYVKYPIRWLMLFLFCLLEMANALFWVSFAPIFDITSNYFGGDGAFGNPTAINMFANVFLIGYPLGTLMASVSMKRYGLKRSLLIAGFLTMLGALVRVFAALYKDQLGNGSAYGLMLLGQCLASIAQPYLLNMPPTIASTWFPVFERDITTTVGTLCSPIGNAIGSVLPVLIVSQTTHTNASGHKTHEIHGMLQSLLVQFYICAVAFFLVLFFFKGEPPTAPSKSTKLKRDDANQQSLAESWQSFLKETKVLFSDRDYVLLFSAFSMLQGFFCAVLTLVFQIIEPYGYTNKDAGTFGTILIISGVTGAVFIGSYMERSKAYRRILKMSNIACSVAFGFFLCMIFSDNYWPLLISFGAVGFFLLPSCPVSTSNAAECTYPVSEELSVGYMFVGCNLVGLVLTFALQFLLRLAPLGPPPLVPSSLFFVAVLGLQNLLMMMFNGQYKRLEHDTRVSISEHTPTLNNVVEASGALGLTMDSEDHDWTEDSGTS